ncbi:hypothetical protein B0I35DRAFT_59224 [Stachybotrys elegans]|uniref:Uncharacterized protein n=1 Tax=Stachybotrys elegans TaxID=80388 RepID=A0A8K0WNK4_9HYPO|nr:hypothetical protein B0I35DRAFT_59224 [Stachybotrys elegans]
MVLMLLINSFVRRHGDALFELIRAGMNSASIRALCQRPEQDTDAIYCRKIHRERRPKPRRLKLKMTKAHQRLDFLIRQGTCAGRSSTMPF